MVEVTIEGDKALFTVEGLHKLWCFRSRLEIPLALDDERYRKLIVQVADPQTTAAALRAAASR